MPSVRILTSEHEQSVYQQVRVAIWVYDGYAKVIQTFEQSETPTLFPAPPRRVLPMNVYYHFLSGARSDSLDALMSVYDYVSKRDTCRIFASEYCRVVRGFLSARYHPTGDGGFRFQDYGACRTVRFDGASDLFCDLSRSKGVLGFNT